MKNEFKVKGTIHYYSDIISLPTKKGDVFLKQSLVLEVPNRFIDSNEYIKLEIIGDNAIDRFGGYLNLGSVVEVTFKLKGKPSLYQGKETYFTNLEVVAISEEGIDDYYEQPTQPTQQKSEQQRKPSFDSPKKAPKFEPHFSPVPPSKEEDLLTDDLPF